MATYILDPLANGFQTVKRRFLDALGDELRAGARSVTIAEPKRSTEQNARMWALLTDVSDQVGWRMARWRGDRCLQVGAYVPLTDEPDAKRLTPEQFKAVLSAALTRPQLFAGVDGGIVQEAARTSRMTKKELSDLMTLIEAFGADRGVRWTSPT